MINILALHLMFIVNLRSTSSVALDLTMLDRHQLQLEMSQESRDVDVSLPIGRLAHQVMSPNSS